jgi:hypothetical protein
LAGLLLLGKGRFYAKTAFFVGDWKVSNHLIMCCHVGRHRGQATLPQYLSRTWEMHATQTLWERGLPAMGLDLPPLKPTWP